MHNNRYTFLYAIGLSVLTAVVLVFTSEKLKPAQEANVALDTKKNILKSVLFNSEIGAEIEKIYAGSVQELVLNGTGEVLEGNPAEVNLKEEVSKSPSERQLPLYIFTGEGGEKSYVIPMRGVGLWGPIWGYISIKDDFNTVKGAFFDHKSETPGLGAEIAEKPFQEQFEGKEIKDEQGGFVSVNVMKPAAKSDLDASNRVDAISGGTITSNGTDEMLKNCIEPYLNYFNKLKK